MAATTKISELMTKGVFSVTYEDTIHKAHEIMMDEKVRHVPVTDNGKYIGMITEGKIVEYSLRKLYEYDDAYGAEGYNKISDFENIMDKSLPYIYPEDSVAKALELMMKKKIDCLPVVDWKINLLGLLTSTDLLLFFHKKILEEA